MFSVIFPVQQNIPSRCGGGITSDFKLVNHAVVPETCFASEFIRTSTSTTTMILTMKQKSLHLQYRLNTLQTWFEKWRIRINENKSCSITFTLKKSSTLDLTINDIQISRNTEIIYLGMTIDSKLTWSSI
jgi:hypothetical protein